MALSLEFFLCFIKTVLKLLGFNKISQFFRRAGNHIFLINQPTNARLNFIKILTFPITSSNPYDIKGISQQVTLNMKI